MASHDDKSTFSLERIRAKILEGHAQADWHQRERDDLIAAIQTAEAQLIVCMSDNSTAEQQALVSAVRHLDELLNGPSVDFIEPAPDDNAAFAVIESSRFKNWLAQASPEELAGLEQSMAIAGGIR